MVFHTPRGVGEANAATREVPILKNLTSPLQDKNAAKGCKKTGSRKTAYLKRRANIGSMSQTNAIILKFHEKYAADFEKLFKDEVLPLWKEYKKAGKFISASLTPIQGGWSPPKGQRYYILHVEVPSMAEHGEFDSDPVFTRFLEKAQAMQAEEPFVWFGKTLFQV